MFAWRYLDAYGREVGRSEIFEDRDSAESWLSQEWAELNERGIEEVELFDSVSDEAVYRMGLGPAQS